MQTSGVQQEADRVLTALARALTLFDGARGAEIAPVFVCLPTAEPHR